MNRVKGMSRHTSHTVGDEVDSLKADVAKLRSDITGLAQALLRAGKDEAGEAKSYLQDGAQKGVDGVRSALKNAKDMGETAISTVEGKVGERPVASLLVAFAAGLIFAGIMRRR